MLSAQLAKRMHFIMKNFKRVRAGWDFGESLPIGWQTDVTENITFDATSLVGGKDGIDKTYTDGPP